MMDYEANRHLFISVDHKRLTVGLFKETVAPNTRGVPPFSLADWRKVYVKHADPTEYLPAMELIGDWGHWQLVRNHPRIKPIMDEWQREVEVKLRSEAVRDMMRHAKKDGGSTAAKWIAEGGFAKRDMRKKDDKAIEEKIKEEIADHVADDAARLGLTVIQGGK